MTPETNKTSETTDRIRQLNDDLQTNMVGGEIVMSKGMSELPGDILSRVLLAVIKYDWSQADEGDDPYGEHDFGCVEDKDVGKVFWKIDYYDKKCSRIRQ